MENVELNKQTKLSPHFKLGELCKTSLNSLDGNIPGQEEIENWVHFAVRPPKVGNRRKVMMVST